jgi:hypothetical protein
MTVQPGRSARKREKDTSVSPIMIAVVSVVLLAFVGWLAYANLFAPPKPAPMDAKGQANHDFIKRLAKQSGGDINKLSPEDQQKLRELAKGYGAIALKKVFEEK